MAADAAEPERKDPGSFTADLGEWAGGVPQVSARARKELKEGLEAMALIAFGVAFYVFVERKPCDEDGGSCECDASYLETFGAACTAPWTVVDALYFTLVSISTVGYGDFAPKTVAGQVFTILFCFIGIVFIFSELADLVGGVMHPFYSAVQRYTDAKFPPKTIDLQGDGTADVIIPRSAPIFYASRLLAPISVVFGLQIVSAFVYVELVPEWTLWQAFYHCIITATTVGYGDMHISTEDGRVFACFHLMLSVCLLAALISEVGTVQATRKSMLEKVERVRKQLDRELILSLDKDQNGLDKFEFVTGMLVKLELVPESEVVSFIELFEFLDDDHSGQLTKKELNQMVDQWQRQFDASSGLARSKTHESKSRVAPLPSPASNNSECVEEPDEWPSPAPGPAEKPALPGVPAAPAELPSAVPSP